MAEILPDALKENKCEGLLRLIAGLADGAGRPKSARILRLADVKGDRKKAGEMRVRPRFFFGLLGEINVSETRQDKETGVDWLLRGCGTKSESNLRWILR
jgi:hypothetical protein